MRRTKKGAKVRVMLSIFQSRKVSVISFRKRDAEAPEESWADAHSLNPRPVREMKTSSRVGFRMVTSCRFEPAILEALKEIADPLVKGRPR